MIEKRLKLIFERIAWEDGRFENLNSIIKELLYENLGTSNIMHMSTDWISDMEERES